jgi:hypothetical protein
MREILYIVAGAVVVVISIYILIKLGFIPFTGTVSKQDCINMIMLACDEYRSKGKLGAFNKISIGCADIVESASLKDCLKGLKENIDENSKRQYCSGLCKEFGL